MVESLLRVAVVMPVLIARFLPLRQLVKGAERVNVILHALMSKCMCGIIHVVSDGSPQLARKLPRRRFLHAGLARAARNTSSTLGRPPGAAGAVRAQVEPV